MSGESSQPSDEEKVFFLFGSETGNAESIAKRLHHDAVNAHGLTHAVCMSLNQFVAKKVLDEHLAEEVATSLCLVIVCSTTGEGEPPLNASRFRRWLRNTTGTLHKVRYGVLALGDTNYNNFCAPGIFMDNKLHEMGAVRFYPRGEADDGVGLDLVVDPWTQNVWAALKSTDTGSMEAVGCVKYSAGEARVDMSVAQEAAILYSNASQLCSVAALFLYERIVELGGKADLYPIQYFNPQTSLTRPPKVLLFVVATDADETTLCEYCACQPQQLPPLGPFSAWMSGSDTSVAPVDGGEELRAWMADPSLRFFSSLIIAPTSDRARCAERLDANLKAAATLTKLEFLCQRQSSGEVPSVAVTHDEVCSWIEGVLDSLPGVTASADVIHRSIEYFFDGKVGLEFRNTIAARDVGKAPAQEGAGTREVLSNIWMTSTNPQVRFCHGLPECGKKHSSAADGTRGYPLTPQPGEPLVRERGGTVSKSHQVLDDLLTPVVFLYTDKSSYVKRCALDIFEAASQHHLRSSVCELSNFRQTGFPRRATFVFIVSGVLTKSMARVLKVLRTLQAQGKQVSGVNFAILGIDKSSESDKFNACALELETLLLEMKATKIHCTGLADMDGESLLAIIESWESNLWSAIVHPMKSAAYLDTASPSICVQQSFSPLVGGDVGGGGRGVNSPVAGSTAARVFADRRSSPTSPPPNAADFESGSSGANSGVVAGPVSIVNRLRSTGSAAFSLYTPPTNTMVELAWTGLPSRLPLATPIDAVGEGSGVAKIGSLSSPTADGVVAGAATTTSLFPWDTVPLHKENALHTPVAFLYASAGMSKTMALNAMQCAEEKGFPTVMHSFANYHLADFRAHPNLVLFCEAGPDGQSNGGRRFKKFLTHPLHRPDDLSFVRFAVLGLGSTPSNVVHPAFLWAKLLSRLQANRVFPVVIMPSMSQLHTLGIPWAECVLASMALLPPTMPLGQTSAGSINTMTVSDGVSNAKAAGEPGYALANASPAASREGVSDNTVTTSVDPQRCLLVLFGSSTGITESIARDLHREALERGFHSRIAALKYFQKMNFLSTANVVLVCSTIPTAPGGFPRNARSFARYLLAQDQPATLLSGTSFAVLGVGNGTATREGPLSYCRTAVRFDRRMAELGGHRLCAVGTVDAAQAIALPVEDWRRALFDALETRAAEQAALRKEEEEARRRNLLLLIAGVEYNGVEAALEKLGSLKEGNASNSSAAAVADLSQRPPKRVMIAYCCTPTSVVEELSEHLAHVIADFTPMVPSVFTMNDLLKQNWRSEFDVLIFVVGQNGEAEFPLNGSVFARVLRQRTAPLDMFASVSYTVLAVLDSNSTQFYMGRQLDRRLEELGGTRVYARGEVVDSFRLERTVEKWSMGLVALLTSMCDNVANSSDVDDDVDGNAGPTGVVREAKTVSSEVNAGELLRALPRAGDAAVQRSGRNERRLSAIHLHGTDRAVFDGSSAATASRDERGGGGDSTAKAREDGGEDPQMKRLSASGSLSGVASSSVKDNDWQTESSLVNRIAYSANNAGDRVDGVVHSFRLLTASQADRPVLQLNLSVNAETQWTPGQTVAILPSNNSVEVEALLQIFKVAHHEPFHPLSIAGAEASCFPTSPLYDAVDFPVSCGTILLRYVDLRVTRSHKMFFQLLEKNAPTEAVTAAVKQYAQTFAQERTPRALLEVLDAFPTCVPPLRHVVETLTLLQPRQYSICSSHQADPATLSICFKFVDKGLCTGWLCEQCLWASKLPMSAIASVLKGRREVKRGAAEKGDSAAGELVQPNTLVLAKRRVLVPFVIRRASEFRMPRDPLIPMVLIGPGTGIAPFRAFLQEREAWLTQRQQQCGSTCPKGQFCGCPYAEATHTSQAICGSIDLFGGCHRRDEDFLFGEELQRWEEEGVLHSMTVAFSREANEGGFWYGGCYVQDKLQECAVALMDLVVQRNAHVYVCGDADGMAKEVHATLLELIQQHLSLSDTAAVEYLDQMSKDGRYLRDVWSTSF
jgi:sulfite reductase alpha subunit-like flavoprotein